MIDDVLVWNGQVAGAGAAKPEASVATNRAVGTATRPREAAELWQAQRPAVAGSPATDALAPRSPGAGRP
jgi:hypothetical protein